MKKINTIAIISVSIAIVSRAVKYIPWLRENNFLRTGLLGATIVTGALLILEIVRHAKNKS
jgi:hypothetical protein